MPWFPPSTSPDADPIADSPLRKRSPRLADSPCRAQRAPSARRPRLLSHALPVLLWCSPVLVLGADMGSALAAVAYLLVAELLAVLGSATEVALECHSRSRVLALAEARGVEDVTTQRFALLPTFELTARLVRFLGHALLVTGIAYVIFRSQLPATAGSGIPWGPFGVVLAILFGLTFLINGVLVRVLVARRPNQVLLAALPYLGVMRWVTYPLRLPLVLIVKLLFRVDLDAPAPSPREEILESVGEGEREGSFTPEEADMIESIIEMERTLVKDILTPRADVVMIQSEATLDEAVQLSLDEGYSRIPVYGKDRDDVIGVLYAHDLLAHWANRMPEREAEPPTVRDLMRTPFFVPENKSLNDLLKEMRALKVHMAVVLDEFNGTEGLVTIEDLLEEIVGEIEDEYDDDSATAPPTDEEKAAGIFRIEGRSPIDEVNARYEVNLPVEEDFETLGGLVFHRLGKVPSPGDRIEIDNVIITVVEADERTAQSLLLRVLPDSPENVANDESAA